MGNNPVNLTDPTGEIAPIVVAGGVGGAIGAVGGGIGYVLAHPGGRPEDYLRSGGFWRSVGVGAASGALAGAVGWAVPSLLPAAGSVWGSMGLGAVSGSLAGGAGQIVANLLNPCVEWHEGVLQAMAVGGVTGGIAGGVGYGIRQRLAARPPRASPPLLEPPKMQKHHIFPQRFRPWFAQRGIDIDSYTVELSRGTHLRGVHGRGGFVGPGNTSLPGRWNALWKAFKDANPNATAREVYQFAGQIMDQFGLGGLPIVRY